MNQKTHNFKCKVLVIEYTYKAIDGLVGRVVSELKNSISEDQVKILTYDSIQNYSNGFNEKQKIINGVDVVDVSLFKTKKFDRIIDAFDPQVVIMLNHSFIMDRVAIKTCRKKGIKTVFIQHGIQSFELSKKTDIIKTVFDKIRRYSTYLQFYILQDLSKLVDYKFYKMLYLMLRTNYSLSPSEKSDEIHCDYAFAWGEAYRQSYIKSNNYNPDNVFIIGYPDYDRFLKEKGKSFDLQARAYGFISQPLLVDGIISEEEHHSLINYLLPFSKDMYLKIHPRDDLNNYDKLIENGAIVVDEVGDFFENSNKIIGHFSSLLYLALMQNKEVIIYDKFNNKLCKDNIILAHANMILTNEISEADDTIDMSTNKIEYYLSVNPNGAVAYSKEMILRILGGDCNEK